MNKYFLKVDWKNQETTMVDNLTWLEVIEKLKDIYSAAMNESVYQVKFYPVVVRQLQVEEKDK